ncbi:DEAD/DEAH box helicase [Deinococcus sp. 6YEL10]|uniref:DEAD/DEAH box helicase n=1 Tax=Deinococcus sp. 6YEL10 TaxID=2745870 RepID=UPI001E5A22BD|nr:DEAD/DEAH box helicase [Deinococcus sp. 6YEL10]MCD0159733.1 DEAD/DEAH box helicase [Deinococcus sp. 6YEL10]
MAETFQLRSYQRESVDRLFDAQSSGILNVLGVAATGSGKTEMFLEAAERALRDPTGDPLVIVMAHRDELVNQPYQRILKRQRLYGHFPALRPSVVKAELNDWSGNIIFTSVQSMSQPRRLTQLAQLAGRVRLVVIDEAHHAASEEGQYGKVVRALGCLPVDRRSGPLLFGVTATPNRTDKIGLARFFSKEIFRWDMRYLMERGYLTPIRARLVKTGVDISHVKLSRGDFHQSQLSAALNTTEANQQMIDVYRNHCHDEPMVAFMASVEHARVCAEMFNSSGVPAAAIYGEMSAEDRKQALDDFNTGKLRVLLNFNVLTEGFDAPHIRHVFMRRPTKSTSVYIQAVGRGTRLSPGKEFVTIWDFHDVTKRHAIVQVTDLFGLKERPDPKTDLLSALQEQELAEAQEEERRAHIPLVDFEDVDIWNIDAMVDLRLQEMDEFRTEAHTWRTYTSEKPIIGRNGAGYPVYGQPRKLYCAELNETDIAVCRMTRQGDALFYRVDVMRDDGTVPVSVSFGLSYESQTETIRQFEQLYARITPTFQQGHNEYLSGRQATEKQLGFLARLMTGLARERKIKHFKLATVAEGVVGDRADFAVTHLSAAQVSDLIGMAQYLLVRRDRPVGEFTAMLELYLGQAAERRSMSDQDLDDLFSGVA